MHTAEAMAVLKDAIARDEMYAWSWHCNIAMAYVDKGGDREIANKAANHFMQLCFGVDTKDPAGNES